MTEPSKTPLTDAVFRDVPEGGDAVVALLQHAKRLELSLSEGKAAHERAMASAAEQVADAVAVERKYAENLRGQAGNVVYFWHRLYSHIEGVKGSLLETSVDQLERVLNRENEIGQHTINAQQTAPKGQAREKEESGSHAPAAHPSSPVLAVGHPQNPATVIQGTQPSESGRYTSGTSVEPDGGTPKEIAEQDTDCPACGDGRTHIKYDGATLWMHCSACGSDTAGWPLIDANAALHRGLSQYSLPEGAWVERGEGWVKVHSLRSPKAVTELCSLLAQDSGK